MNGHLLFQNISSVTSYYANVNIHIYTCIFKINNNRHTHQQNYIQFGYYETVSDQHVLLQLTCPVCPWMPLELHSDQTLLESLGRFSRSVPKIMTVREAPCAKWIFKILSPCLEAKEKLICIWFSSKNSRTIVSLWEIDLIC